jgi:hypothetical protein
LPRAGFHQVGKFLLIGKLMEENVDDGNVIKDETYG